MTQKDIPWIVKNKFRNIWAREELDRAIKRSFQLSKEVALNLGWLIQ